MERQIRAGAGSSRRQFIGGAVAGGAAALAAGPLKDAAASSVRHGGRPYQESHRVDLHCHHLPPVYLDALHKAGIVLIGGIPIPAWSPKLALQFMDAHGIAVQMLSISDPAVTFAAAGDQAALAREVNDYVAGVVKAHPRRFGAFAVVPMASIDEGRAEVERATTKLRLDGIGLLSSYDGKYLGDPMFDPLLADLDRHRAWVFVHPTHLPANEKPSYSMPDFLAEYPFDTTRTIISLIFNGVFHRFPHIRWHFAHGGGTVPMLEFRLNFLSGLAKEFGPALGLPTGAKTLTASSARKALRASWFDTALIAAVPSLVAVEHMAGYEHTVFGSDWPFAARLYGPKGDPQPELSRVFGAAQRHAIDRLNARGQFKRLRAFIPGRES